MTVFEMVNKYYPKLWDEKRLAALVAAGKLTEEEYEAITGNGCVTEEVS